MTRCDACIEKRNVAYWQTRNAERGIEYTQLCNAQSTAMLREDWQEYNRLGLLIKAF